MNFSTENSAMGTLVPEHRVIDIKCFNVEYLTLYL